MNPELDAAIRRQWADDEEYVDACRFMALDLEEEWQIEARLRSAAAIPPFVREKLRPEWREVVVVPSGGGGEELLLRREQPLTLDAVKAMSASLVRLAHIWDLDWLNWSEFDGHIHRSLHRTPLDWTFDPAD